MYGCDYVVSPYLFGIQDLIALLISIRRQLNGLYYRGIRDQINVESDYYTLYSALSLFHKLFQQGLPRLGNMF